MRPTCYLDDCERPHHAQGLCMIHYSQQRKRSLKDGTWENVQVDAEPFKDRIRQFLDLGYNYAMLSALTGIERNTFCRALSKDRKTAISDNVEKLEKLPLTPLYELWRTDIGVDYKVPSYLASRRVKALMAKGYSTAHIAEETGLSRQTFTRLAFRDPTGTDITRSNLVKINDAYDRLWDQEPPAHYHHSDLKKYEKWPLPLEWDDDEIDLPNTDKLAKERARERTYLARKVRYRRSLKARKTTFPEKQ